MLTKIKDWFKNERLGPHPDGSFHEWKVIDLNTGVCVSEGCNAYYDSSGDLSPHPGS